MILSLVVIALIGTIAYVWASRGFFSSLIHMICVLVAGAMAFGLWEPIAYFVLSQEPPSWVTDAVWGASLAIPFAVILGLLRLGIDSLLPANTDLDGVTNLVGGGVCGAVSGVVSVGILVLSVSFLRLPTSLAGYQPMGFDSGGSVQRERSLLFPADRITVGLYGFMSRSTLRTATPLDVWRPRLADEGHLLRVNFNEGGARNTITPKSFDVVGRYTVGKGASIPLRDLSADSFYPDRPQSVKQMDGSTPPTGSYIEGVIVNFKAGAREKEGRIVIGNSQIRMVCEPVNDPGGETIAVHPFAMVSQAGGDRLDLGRWRFDRPKIFIASVGGASEAPMAFEFMVPPGYQPLAVYVKGVRYDLRAKAPAQQFADVRARDGAVRQRALLSGVGGGRGELDRSRAVRIDPSVPTPSGESELFITGGLANRLMLSKDGLGGLQIDETNRIFNGDAKFRASDLAKNRTIDRALQVREFAASEDTRVAQVRVDGESRIGLLTDAGFNADPTRPAYLIDDRGQRYQALGYVYQDSTEVHIRMTPGRPLAAISELPNGGPTTSRPDQRFYLVFRVSQGVNLKYFAVGDTVLGEFDPPVTVHGF